MNRNDNLKLLDEFVESLALKRHMFAVEAAVRAYAEGFSWDATSEQQLLLFRRMVGQAHA